MTTATHSKGGHHAPRSGKPIDRRTAGMAGRSTSATPPPGVRAGIMLTTNQDAWRVVHECRAAGMTIGSIAARYDLSYQMVGNWARMPKPPQIHPLGCTAGPCAKKPLDRCAECNAIVSYTSRPTRCQKCEHDRCARIVAEHRATIAGWAVAHGVVPTVREAATILGLSRGRAGDIIIEVFGRDTMPPQYRQHHGRRRWPATDRADG